MNASEISTEIRKTIHRAITEGIAPEDGKSKVSFENIIGILETHKQALYDWRAQMMFAQAQAEAARKEIIVPFRGQIPPVNGERK